MHWLLIGICVALALSIKIMGMNNIGKSLCNTCIHVNTCSLTSSKVFIWSCSEFKLNEEKKESILTTDTNNLELIKNKREIEFI